MEMSLENPGFAGGIDMVNFAKDLGSNRGSQKKFAKCFQEVKKRLYLHAQNMRKAR